MNDRPESRTSPSTGTGTPNVTWDDSNMRSLYSNVCNVTGTREEIVLLFGVHQAWRTEMKDVTVQLQDRIILNPFAAKRLNMLLSRVIKEYEARHGVLPIEVAGQPGPSETLPNS